MSQSPPSRDGPAPRRRRSVWSRLAVTAEHSVRNFIDDHCTKLAAAISFHVLFSVFPLAILLVAGSGLVLRRESLRGDLLDVLVDAIPVSEEGARELERLLESVATGRSALGFAAAAVLLWSASGVMAAIRTGLNLAWDVEEERPALWSKLLDLALVLGVAVPVALSLALTLAVQLAHDLAERAGDALGPLAASAAGAAWFVGLLAAFLLSFVTALTLYHVVPKPRPPLRHIWPGALFAAAAFEAAKQLFALYLDHFASYNAVYGSLGAVTAALAFVYVAANLFLLGAEIAAMWPRAATVAVDEPPPPPIVRRVAGALRGLVVSPAPDPGARPGARNRIAGRRKHQ